MQPRFPSPSLSTGLHAAGPSPSGPAATVLTCLVMACGATFGITAQILLQRLGLGLDDIRNDVLAHRAATRHFALAWWAWSLFALGAFLIGPLCAATTQAIFARRRPMRGLRLFAATITVLGLAAVAQSRSFSPAAAVATHAVVNLLVVIGSTVLALLGTRLLGGTPRGRLRHSRGSLPAPTAPSGREGSANSGLPLLPPRRRHRWAHRSSWGTRAALVAQVAILAGAPVSVLAGSAVLLHLSPAGTVVAWNVWQATFAGTPTAPRLPLPPQLPSDQGGFAMPAAAEAPAVSDRVALLVARKRQIATAIGHGAPLSESELTFTKGYPRRRAAQIAAGMISPSAIPQLATATDVASKDAFGRRLQ